MGDKQSSDTLLRALLRPLSPCSKRTVDQIRVPYYTCEWDPRLHKLEKDGIVGNPQMPHKICHETPRQAAVLRQYLWENLQRPSLYGP